MVRRKEEGYSARTLKNSFLAVALVMVLLAVSVVPVTATDGDVNANPDAIHSDTGFSAPFGIAVEADGSLVVTDYGLKAVVRVNPTLGRTQTGQCRSSCTVSTPRTVPTAMT